jgi:hypothetical protein
MEIGSSISGARYYALQQFREPEQYQGSNVYRLTHKPHPAAFFLELQEELLQTIEQVVIRGINGQSKAQPSFNEASI